MKRPAGLIAAVLVALAGCQPLASGVGELGLRVDFPARGFQTQVIPALTTRIEVTVTGEGLAVEAKHSLTREAPSWKPRLPVGPKTVTAIAVGADGRTLAKGSAAATVRQDATVRVTLTLTEEPEASPSPTPSGSSPAGTVPSGTPTAPTPTSQPTTAPTAAPRPTPHPTMAGGGAGGGAGTLAPSPSPTISAAITVHDGNPSGPLGFTP